MTKLIRILNAWVCGCDYKGLIMPNVETYYELAGICRGVQKTTINSDVVKVLEYCGIKYKEEGIGWRVL